MASITCCLNLSPSPPNPNPSSITRSNQLNIIWSKRNEGSCLKRCAVGMASMMIALEMGNLLIGETRALDNVAQFVESKNYEQIARWSDKRMCPPWRLNSLETIIPENLPRPSGRRRWEWVDYNSTDFNAPAVGVITSKISSKCFSM